MLLEYIIQPVNFEDLGFEQFIAEGEIRGAPDLVVEILSPATEVRGRGYKRTLYARYGVKEYWFVDSRLRMVEVLALGEEGFVLHRAYQGWRC